MSQAAPEIPDKKPGEAYTITLSTRARDVHGGATGKRRAPSEFPVPAFTDTCICCNQPAGGQRHAYGPWSQNGYARQAIELPLCSQCTEHAFAPLDPAGFALLPLVPGVMATLIGLWWEQPTLQLVGICISVFALLCFALWHLSGSYRGTAVHHEGIDIDAMPGRLRIATRNRELVRTVVALNTPLVESVD